MQTADDVTVTLVSSTWRASVFEIRGPDSEGEETVRWVTVPRRDVERFTAAVAAGALALALRGVLEVEGRFVPASFDDEFGVFDTRPDDAFILSPERGDKSGRRDQTERVQHAQKAGRRPRPRQLAMVAGGGAAVVVLGLVAMQLTGDDTPSVSPAALTTVDSPVTTVAPVTTAATTTSTSTSTSSTTTTSTLAELLGPRFVVSQEIEETIARNVFPGGQTRPFDNDPLVIEVDCVDAPQCALRIVGGLTGEPLELPIVDGRVTETGVLPIQSDVCAPRHVVTVVPDLAFEFEPGQASPRRVIGWITASSETFQVGNTTCVGSYVEWEVDSPLDVP